MSRIKIVNGEEVPLTAEENAEIDFKEQQWADAQSERDAQNTKRKLSTSDIDLIRAIEDLIDWAVTEGGWDKEALPLALKNKINNRKNLRDTL